MLQLVAHTAQTSDVCRWFDLRERQRERTRAAAARGRKHEAQPKVGISRQSDLPFLVRRRILCRAAESPTRHL